MKKNILPLLGIPLLLGTLTLSLPPVGTAQDDAAPPFIRLAVDTPAKQTTEAQQESDPPQSLDSNGVEPPAALIFRTTLPQRGEMLPETIPSPPEEASNHPVLTGVLAPNSAELLSAPIPPGLPQNFPSDSSPFLFSRLSEPQDLYQLRRKGPFLFSFNLNSSAVFDDNVSLRQSDKKSDIQIGIGPSARFQLGSDDSKLRLGANYSGNASWFMSTPKQRSFEQNLSVGGEWTGSRLKTALRLGLQSNHNGSLDAGARVGSTVSYAGATVSCRLGGKTSADLGADITKASYSSLLESREYRTQQYLNYQYSPKLQIGLGTTQGLSEAESSSRQTYLQSGLRIVTQPTGKLGFNVSVGNEWRHFDSGQPGTSGPVFSAGVAWQATGKTSVSLEARRRTFASAALVSQNYESTTISLSANEALTPTLNASVSLGVDQAVYSSSSPGIQATRNDNYVFSRVGLSWALRRNCSLATFYEFSQNESTGAQSRPFQRNRTGISLSISL